MEWFFEYLTAFYKVNKVMRNCIIFLLGGIIGILATLYFTYTTTPHYSFGVVNPPLEYYESIVAEKHVDTTALNTPWYQIILKAYDCCNYNWYTVKVNVSEEKYKSYNVGDTIRIWDDF